MNTLRIFHFLFDTIGIVMRRIQILKVRIFRYDFHILFIKIGHCIDEQLIFKVGISNTTQFHLITSRDFDGISIFVINRERNVVRK